MNNKNYISKYLKYKQKYNILKGGVKDEYCLYLTLDVHARPGVHWGGIHITIVGRGNTLQQLLRVNPNFNQTPGAVSPSTWRLNINPRVQIQNLNGVQAICFNSQTLDTLADTLRAQNLQRIKGMRYSGNPWHIAFSGDIQALLNFLTSNNPYWHLTICTIHNGDEHNCTWRRLDTLQQPPPPPPPPFPQRRQLRIGFDFDGVIHTSVGPPDHNGSRNPFVPLRPFQEIIQIIRDYHSRGHIIFIITARRRCEPIIDFLRGNNIGANIIPDNNISAIGNNSKVDKAIQLGLDTFYDDSPKNIIDFTTRCAEIQRWKPNFRLYQTFPTANTESGTIQRIPI